ncbi:MAG: hypothetical protein JXR73_18045 [Candidatus Omnitrophica bacterium]|nr:hypothetical protein [Candidatus Omnitrophota bacterium]
MREIIQNFPWGSRIAMQKEMIEWCIRQGYFKIDNLKRLQVPPVIEDACNDIFAELDENDPEAVEDAVELIKAALRCFHNDLERCEEDALSYSINEDDREKSTLYANLDTSDVKLRSHRKGMATAQHSGASEIDKRIHSAEGAMERRRLEERDK